jgi:hypothetical protein
LVTEISISSPIVIPWSTFRDNISMGLYGVT